MIVIFGGSGHAKEIAFILRSLGKEVCYFITNEGSENKINNTSIISEDFFFESVIKEPLEIDAFIAVGNSKIRKSIVEKIKVTSAEIKFPNLFYKTFEKDILDSCISLGEGNIFFPNTVLTTDINIGSHNHFNVGTSVSHDCIIGDFNSFSPGTHIAGNVTIGNFNFFGINSTVINNINLANNIVVGAGSTVVRNITVEGTYVGLPAKRIK